MLMNQMRDKDVEVRDHCAQAFAEIIQLLPLQVGAKPPRVRPCWFVYDTYSLR